MIPAQPAIIIHHIAQAEGRTGSGSRLSDGPGNDPADGGDGQHLPQQVKLNGAWAKKIQKLMKNTELFKEGFKNYYYFHGIFHGRGVPPIRPNNEFFEAKNETPPNCSKWSET